MSQYFHTVCLQCYFPPSISEDWLKRIWNFLEIRFINRRQTYISIRYCLPRSYYTTPRSRVCLHVPHIMVPDRLPLFCVRNVGRVEGNIHARADLPNYVVFVNRTLMSVDLSTCLKFNQISHLCSAQLHLQTNCLSEASTCTLMTKQYE